MRRSGSPQQEVSFGSWIESSHRNRLVSQQTTMAKFIVILLLIACSFAAGYYLGQKPIGTLQANVSDLSKRLAISEETMEGFQQSVKKLSRDALDTTIRIERDLRRRQGLLEAKSKVVQAKADILDENFTDATKGLADAVAALEPLGKGTQDDPSTEALSNLTASLRQVRLETAMGKSVSVKKLHELERRVDQLLNK
jgi:cell division protein FtsL